MNLHRRYFMKLLGVASSLVMVPRRSSHAEIHQKDETTGSLGVVVDTTVCVGCRKCEWACNEAHRLKESTAEQFEERGVFKQYRRPDATSYTVVNRFMSGNPADKPGYLKVQCMHCNRPACVSGCLVGALQKDKSTGAVVYDSWRCIGCRYCLVACPFQIPAYEYHNALTPQVRKCTFCFNRIQQEDKVPACVANCPVEALFFGQRSELIAFARQKIREKPDRYEDHLYGENELGGTSWMYLSGVPMREMRMPEFGPKPIPEYTEPLQHALFKNFVPPLSLFMFIGGIMWLSDNKNRDLDENKED